VASVWQTPLAIVVMLRQSLLAGTLVFKRQIT